MHFVICRASVDANDGADRVDIDQSHIVDEFCKMAQNLPQRRLDDLGRSMINNTSYSCSIDSKLAQGHTTHSPTSMCERLSS